MTSLIVQLLTHFSCSLIFCSFGFKQHSEKEKTKLKSVSITKISFKIFLLELVQELESALLSKRNKNS